MKDIMNALNKNVCHSREGGNPFILITANAKLEWNPASAGMTGASDLVIVLVPSEDVLLTKVALPKVSRSKQLKALPFALEDAVISNVNELHFILGPYDPTDNKFHVAIVNKQKLESWLTQLSSHNIQANCLLPTCLALNNRANEWRVVTDNTTAAVNTGDYSGFGCETKNLAEMLELHLTTDATPDKIIIDTYGKPTALPTGENIIINKHDEENFFTAFSPKLNHPLNLLQGPYAPKPLPHHNKKVWKIAAIALVAWVALMLLGNVVSYLSLTHQSHTLENQLQAIYQKHFPPGKLPSERTLKARFAALSHQQQANPLLMYLNEVAKANKPQLIDIKQITYRNGELTIGFNAESTSKLDALTEQLQKNGLDAKQHGIVLNADKLTGTLQIAGVKT